jgi:hypothetical protein
MFLIYDTSWKMFSIAEKELQDDDIVAHSKRSYFCDCRNGKVVPVLWAPRLEGVLVEWGTAPIILWSRH